MPRGNQSHPIPPAASYDLLYFVRCQEKNILWSGEHAAAGEVLSQEEQQATRGRGEVHERVAVGFPQGEIAHQPRMAPAEEEPFMHPPTASSTDPLQRGDACRVLFALYLRNRFGRRSLQMSSNDS